MVVDGLLRRFGLLQLFQRASIRHLRLDAPIGAAARALTCGSSARGNPSTLPIQLDFSTMRRPSGSPSATKMRREKGVNFRP
jgi:hypothetical protein